MDPYLRMEVKFDRGISIPGCGVWLDARRKQPLAVVTHAHSDHAAWHAETVLTPATAALMAARLGKPRGHVHEMAYHQPFHFAAGQITLLPAGHVLGSAMALLETPGERLLYTGDFKLRQSRTAEPAEVVQADRARYQFRCDAAFPLSDHADYDELLECVERVQPKRVYTVHGFVEEFAADLRRRGVEAWALGGGNQLELPLVA
jgi:Cft2 family RNA processing exonuclease